MKQTKCIGGLLVALACAATYADEPFTGTDYSGRYTCQGQDHSEGPYTGAVTLELVRQRSAGAYGAYLFKLEVPGYGAYPGHAAARGTSMAINFANTDTSQKDYGTGIATFTRAPNGKWRFTKFYHQPEYKGGNYGTETCVQQ